MKYVQQMQYRGRFPCSRRSLRIVSEICYDPNRGELCDLEQGKRSLEFGAGLNSIELTGV